MALVVVANGKISSSVITPKHDATVHEHSAVDGETYSTYFPPENETHTSTLTGLGTYTVSGNSIIVGTGAGIGSSRFVKDNDFTPSNTMAVFRFKVASITNGAGNYRMSHIGLTSDFTTDDPETVEYIGFVQSSPNDWACACHTGLNYAIRSIPALVVGDILTIAVSSTAVYFYVNDHLVFTPPPSTIPPGALSVGFSVVGVNAPTATRELGIVYFEGNVSRTGDIMTGTLHITRVKGRVAELQLVDNAVTSIFYIGQAPNANWPTINGPLFFPVQVPTASAPAYVEGGLYYDTTLHKLRVGGATGWETVTSV